jgi:hypothetical protein
LIHADWKKIHVHNFGYWLQARQCKPDCCTSDGCFRYRGVSYTFRAKFVKQTARDLVDAVENTNLLSQQYYVRITHHFFAQCFSKSVSVG